MKITTLLAALLLVALSAGARAADEHLDCGKKKCDPVKVDLDNKASLQRGARTFVNYCLSCHSAGYMRYNRVAEDLGIPPDMLKENLMFASDKPGDLMKVAMKSDDAKNWFKAIPPDLTLITRARKPEWVYTYMRGFYRDDKAHSGWNNIVQTVAMPHVLWELQGTQRPVFTTETETVRVEQNGKRVDKTVERQVFDRFEIERPGTLKPAEYDKEMQDLTNFLVYLGEPVKLVRYHIGVYVLLFLAVFFVFAYLLKKEYWKDVH